MNTMRTCLAVLVAMVCSAVLRGAGASQAKKGIAHGWDFFYETPENLEKNLDQLDDLPFEGVTMSAQMNEPGKKPCLSNIFLDDPAYTKEGMAYTLSVWRKAAKKKSHNFAITLWEPHERLDWKDDRAWEHACRNMAVIAGMVREAGMKGILMDPEDYPKAGQYHLRGDERFAETAALARKRGAQIMSVMSRECPDVTLFCFYLLSNRPALWNCNQDPLHTAEETGDLWPSFVNGLLDALPPTAQIVDGCEYGYALEFDRQGFFRMGNDIRRSALALVAPENRDKYQTQVKLAFGLYLDPYAGLVKYPTKVPFGGSRFKRMVNNFNQAMRVADDYCWFYGERRTWMSWMNSGKAKKTWKEEMPGLYEAVRFVKDPVAQARVWLDTQRSRGTLPKSLVPSGEVKASGKTTGDIFKDWNTVGPSGWWFWQYKDGQGSYGLSDKVGHGDSWSVMCQGTSRGCFMYSIKVAEGDWYVVESYCKGGNRPYMELRWQKKDPAGQQEWITTYMDFHIPYDAKPDKAGWRRCVGVAHIPMTAQFMFIHLYDNLNGNPDAQVWFDSLNIYKMDINEPKN